MKRLFGVLIGSALVALAIAGPATAAPAKPSFTIVSVCDNGVG